MRIATRARNSSQYGALFREGLRCFPEQHHLSTVLASELGSFAWVSERIKAGGTPVEAQRGGALIRADKPTIADAHIHIASPHDEGVLGCEGLAAQKRRQTRDDDRLSALFLLGQGAGRAAEEARTRVGKGDCFGVLVNRPFAGITNCLISGTKGPPTRISDRGGGNNAQHSHEPASSFHGRFYSHSIPAGWAAGMRRVVAKFRLVLCSPGQEALPKPPMKRNDRIVHIKVVW